MYLPLHIESAVNIRYTNPQIIESFINNSITNISDIWKLRKKVRTTSQEKLGKDGY